HRIVVGRCLKYLVRGDNRIVGAISFSSPAWKMIPRDIVLDRIGIRGSRIRDVVINNNRFLILPHARIPHLASRILSLAARRVVDDWSWFYSIKPLLAETFVEPTRFEGTCYRAANWVSIGTTSGYAKTGPSHHNGQQPKLIFLYGLNRTYRRLLLT